MSSAMKFSSVEIHLELIPNLEFIKRAQKKRPSARPASDFMQACVTQRTELVLSHHANKTGQGSSVTFNVSMTVKAAQ
jgi:hypothetical protein